MESRKSVAVERVDPNPNKLVHPCTLALMSAASSREKESKCFFSSFYFNIVNKVIISKIDEKNNGPSFCQPNQTTTTSPCWKGGESVAPWTLI